MADTESKRTTSDIIIIFADDLIIHAHTLLDKLGISDTYILRELFPK